jgi:riboflavin synthase
MFTGIVQARIAISEVVKKPELITFTLTLPESLRDGLKKGASIAVDGVCLTTVDFNDAGQVSFDAMTETLQRTTLGNIAPGTVVNVERSFKMGDEVGGHIVSGHVHGMAQIIEVDKSVPNNCAITFKVPQELMKYIFSKGYAALDGVSLTIVDVDKNLATFSVYFIPETLARTTFGIKGNGDFINLEIDTQTQTIVDTVERVLAEKGFLNVGT